MYELPSGHEYSEREAVAWVTDEFNRLGIQQVLSYYDEQSQPVYIRTLGIPGVKGERTVSLYFGPGREPAVTVRTPSRSRKDNLCLRGLVPADVCKLRRLNPSQ